jgi:hypothetical protein
VFFVATLFERGDNVPRGRHAKPLAGWRGSFVHADGSMHVPPAPTVTAPPGVTIPEAVIPAAVLQGLPDDALVEISWQFSIGGTL